MGMDSALEVPSCPVCGFSSIYTDGLAPCSIRCALVLTTRTELPESISLTDALRLVGEEAKDRGLPFQPDIRDLSPTSYFYIHLKGRASFLWKVDRMLLEAGLNVEYLILAGEPSHHERLYRLSPSLSEFLPAEMKEYSRCLYTREGIYKLAKGRPYWHFLPSR